MAAKPSASDKVVLALIGAGGRGTGVILSIQKNAPNVEVKYVCEVDDSRGGRAIDELSKAQGYKPERVSDLRRVLDDKDVDGVVVCTPEHWHAGSHLGLSGRKRCLRRKKHFPFYRRRTKNG